MGDSHLVDGLVKPLRLDPWVGGRAREALGATLSKHIGTLCKNRPATFLHHYTNAAGLKGLLQSRPIKVWASLATHLNDFAELERGQKLVWGTLEQLLNGPYQGRAAASVVDWRKVLDPASPWTNIYVASFTENEDSLGQWRGYSGKRGYALTFELSALPSEVLFAPVNYDDERAPLLATFGDLVDFYDQYAQGVPSEAVAASLRRGLALAASMYKGPRWREEREWRLVQWCETDDHTDFRDSAGRLIPFHVTALPSELKLTAVTVGPGYEYSIEKQAIELLLRKYGWHDVPVRETKVSLRVF